MQRKSIRQIQKSNKLAVAAIGVSDNLLLVLIDDLIQMPSRTQDLLTVDGKG